MKSCIVYPFLYHANFSRGYSWTIELARRLNMPLALFTVISREYARTEKEACYYAFMKVHGEQATVSTQSSSARVRTKQICMEADTLSPQAEFPARLIQFVNHQPNVIVVLQPDLFSEHDQQQIIHASNSTILLPDGIEDEGMHATAGDNFYETFQRSHHFKISDCFFKRLGNDTRLFNYLTSVFGRK